MYACPFVDAVVFKIRFFLCFSEYFSVPPLLTPFSRPNPKNAVASRWMSSSPSNRVQVIPQYTKPISKSVCCSVSCRSCPVIQPKVALRYKILLVAVYNSLYSVSMRVYVSVIRAEQDTPKSKEKKSKKTLIENKTIVLVETLSLSLSRCAHGASASRSCLALRIGLVRNPRLIPCS